VFGIWVEYARDEWDVSDGGVLYLWRWVVFCGTAVRDAVGGVVGDAVGGVVGDAVGDVVGDAVGGVVGDAVGDVVGDAVGGVVGDANSGIVGKFEYKFVSEWICVWKLLYFILNQWIKFW